MDILEHIIATKREELPAIRSAVDAAIANYPSELLHTSKPSLGEALLKSNTGIIAEFKRRSPSKGWIKEDGRADIIPLSYQENGASALSILTDVQYFGGQDGFIRQARNSGVTLPILYKNFVIDEVQLYAATLCGASAVLLIAACLTKAQCKSLMRKAHELGLEVDVENSFRLTELLPKEAIKVSESGISNPDTVKALRQAGFQGFLIGENFMKTPNPGLALKQFISKLW